MKIIHINSYYNTSSLYKHFENALLKQSLEFETFVPINRKEENITSIEYPSHIHMKALFNELDRYFFFKKQSQIYSYFRTYFPVDKNTILHAHSLFTNGYVAYRNYLDNKTPYIVAVRNTDLNLFFRRLIHLRKVGIKILECAEKIIFMSEPYKEFCFKKYIPNTLQNLIEEKSLIIPNGIDPFWFKKISEEQKSIKEPIKLIFVGEISARKNLLKLIEACDLLISQSIKLELDIVGEVKDQKLKKLINVKKYANYWGFLTKEKLRDIYKKNHIFVLPSIRETFGLVYPEAMSQGLPVIYTKGQGFDKQFPDGTVGYPVKPDDATDIAEKILKVKENYKQLSDNAIKKVYKFDWNKITDKYKQIYESILTR